MRRLSFIFASIAITLWGLAVQAAPRVSISGSEIDVEGIAPGGEALLFGVARATENYAITAHRTTMVLEDSDLDGTVTFDYGGTVPLRSVWLGIDLATGEHAEASPVGFSSRELPWPPQAIPAALNRLELDNALLQVVLVRPRAAAPSNEAHGVWTVRTGDGGLADSDGTQNGRVRVELSDFKSVDGSGSPPKQVTPEDRLFVIDLLSLQWSASGRPGEEP